MLIKQFVYNEHKLYLFSDGVINVGNSFFEHTKINIGDVPIINELTKELLEYYVEWNKQKSFVEKIYFKGD